MSCVQIEMHNPPAATWSNTDIIVTSGSQVLSNHPVLLIPEYLQLLPVARGITRMSSSLPVSLIQRRGTGTGTITFQKSEPEP
jgi:hypothetical protein